ncbi:MAG: putative bifunctional diguanylate cyclase/phosphodiesterase [Sphaerochaetaceae bacterium]
MEKQKPSIGGRQDSRRAVQTTLRVLLLCLFLIIILALFFQQFARRLEQSLWQEKQAQYQYLADQSAQLVLQQINKDQRVLQAIVSRIRFLSRDEAEEVVLASGMHWAESDSYSSIERIGMGLQYATAVQLFDGTALTLLHTVPTQSYEALLGPLFSGIPFIGYWIGPQDTVLWQTDEYRDGSDTLSTDSDDHIQRFSSPLGEDWGQFILVANRGLSPTITLDILRSSVSIAVLIIIIFLIFLLYLLSMDYQYANTLWHLAYEDELTKLPNKNLFVREAKQRLQHARNPYAVMVLDIGKFKLINDYFGYAFGDSLLQHCAGVLPRYVTRDGLCARMSGDKFILLVSYREKASLERRIISIMEESRRFTFPNASLFQLEILLGISLVEESELDINAYIDRALFALSALKENREASYLFYEEALRDHLLEESELENVFSNALQTGQFFIQLQPKYAFHTQHLIGGEALVRWRHPSKGLLNPSQFIPLLEKHNLLVALDMHVLKLVCELFVRWKEEGKPLLPISVNQSRSHLFTLDYEATLVDLIDHYGVDHHLMEFELTETLFLHDLTHLATVLTALRTQGFLVSLDDFGSGYSSLTMLKDVQIDVIKMDQGFFTDLSTNPQGRVVIQHVIAMSKDLGITTIAEGVENEEQAKMLADMGCDGVQGYFYSQPLEVSQYEQLLYDDTPRCFL